MYCVSLSLDIEVVVNLISANTCCVKNLSTKFFKGKSRILQILWFIKFVDIYNGSWNEKSKIQSVHDPSGLSEPWNKV